MKLITAALLINTCAAFAPQGKASFGIVAHSGKATPITQLKMADDPLPFFASKSAKPKAAEQTLEEEVAELTREEVAKTVKVSNLRNANGVDYAPWMNMNAEDEQKKSSRS